MFLRRNSGSKGSNSKEKKDETRKAKVVIVLPKDPIPKKRRMKLGKPR